jgi:hypothetical protein
MPQSRRNQIATLSQDVSMGGVALPPTDGMNGLAPAGLATITAALDAKAAGDSGCFSRVQLALASPVKEPAATAEILDALTHHSASIGSLAPARAADLRRLFTAAINIDFSPFLAQHGAAPVKDAATTNVQDVPHVIPSQLLAAWSSFILNTASADSAFVSELLNAIARYHFKLPQPAFTPLLDAVHDTLPIILDTYPRAEAMLIGVVTDRYPHAIRPAEEHTRYAHAVLTIASYASSHALAASLLSVVIERIATIDAMVPDRVGEYVECNEVQDVPTSRAATPTQPPHVPAKSVLTFATPSPALSASSFPSTDESILSASPSMISASAPFFVLDPVADKLDGILEEFMSYVASAMSPVAIRKSRVVVNRRYEAIVLAFERFVLPSQSARHSPFVLLHAAATRGHAPTVGLAERFRVSFFDPSVPPRVRIAYLHFSTAIIGRTVCVKAADALAWTRKVAAWLHTYVDNTRDTGCVVDTDVHDLFYAATFALMSVVSLRPDIFDQTSGGGDDIANTLRFLRIMSSALNPLLVMPEALVTRFCDVVSLRGGMDLSDIVDANQTRTLPSRTRFGSRNRFSAFLPLEPCALPRLCARVTKMYRHNISSPAKGLTSYALASASSLVQSRKRARSSSPPASPFTLRAVNGGTVKTVGAVAAAGVDAVLERPNKRQKTASI